jgi:hypothetical protein
VPGKTYSAQRPSSKSLASLSERSRRRKKKKKKKKKKNV